MDESRTALRGYVAADEDASNKDAGESYDDSEACAKNTTNTPTRH